MRVVHSIGLSILSNLAIMIHGKLLLKFETTAEATGLRLRQPCSQFTPRVPLLSHGDIVRLSEDEAHRWIYMIYQVVLLGEEKPGLSVCCNPQLVLHNNMASRLLGPR